MNSELEIFSSFDELTYQLNSQSFSKIICLVDTNTQEFCLPNINLSFDGIITIPAGELSKSFDIVSQVISELIDFECDRNTLLVNLGGGVISDLGGFVASIYKRGINFINIPTSLLGMIDAAFGGKTGIDFNEIKNVIGVFNLAKKVIVCPLFLETLPKVQIENGLGEVLKYAFIRDMGLLEHLNADNILTSDWESIIKKCVEIKREIVSIDPLDTGIRNILNAGHTLGHAFESLKMKDSKSLLHGFAVAMGIKVEAFIALEMGVLAAKDFEKVDSTLNQFFPLLDFNGFTAESVSKYILQDKKVSDRLVKIPLLHNLGSDCVIKHVSYNQIVKALQHFNIN